MGVRITLFALDLNQFTTFIQQNVWEWLWYYVDNGPNQGESVRIRMGDTDYFTCSATRATGVKAFQGNRNVSLDRAIRPADSPFSSSLQDYLGSNSVWEFKDFLTALSQCPTNNVARLVTSGCRRWWIGSLLDYTELTLGSTAPDYVYLALLFQRVLGGYDCGKLLPRNDDSITGVRFPNVLHEDPDLRTSLWTEEETWFVVETIRSITSKNTTFPKPPGGVSFPPETDEEWDDWVRRMTTQLLGLDELPLTMRSVVGFIV
jgi:hypothetical protein